MGKYLSPHVNLELSVQMHLPEVKYMKTLAE